MRHSSQFRRLRILRVSADLLSHWLIDERPAVARINGKLPEDARIVGARMDGFLPGVVEFVLESEAFGPVPEGGPIPEVESPTLTSLAVAVDADDDGAGDVSLPPC